MDMLLEAEKRFKDKDFKSALGLYIQIVDSEPNNLIALTALSNCYYNLAHDQIIYANLAIKTSKKIIEIAPHIVNPYTIISYLEADIGEARKYAELALEIDRNSAEALSCYGALLLKEQKMNEAIPYLEKTIQIDPSIYLAHNNLFVAYQKPKDIKKKFNQIKIMFQMKRSLDNLILLHVGYLAINPMILLILTLLPMIINMTYPNYTIPSFLLHVYLIVIYLYNAHFAIKFKTYSILRPSLSMVFMLLFIDIMIYFFGRNFY